MRRYNIQRDIARINEELAKIGELRNTVNSAGWTQVVAVFNDMINGYVQDVFDKCRDPRKNEIEIRCKQMVAEALGSILSTLDGRVKSENFIRKQLEDKAAKQAAKIL